MQNRTTVPPGDVLRRVALAPAVPTGASLRQLPEDDYYRVVLRIVRAQEAAVAMLLGRAPLLEHGL